MLNMSTEDFAQMASGMSQNMTLDQTKATLLTDWAIQADRKTYVYGYTDLLKLDLRDKLSSIKARTIILGAAFPDRDVVRANYEKQYFNLKEKEIVMADNSRHFIMFDQPSWFYTQVNNLVK